MEQPKLNSVHFYKTLKITIIIIIIHISISFGSNGCSSGKGSSRYFLEWLLSGHDLNFLYSAVL